MPKAKRLSGKALPLTLLLTCEHGGNQVPRQYKPLFKEYGDWLTTHRGMDFGALAVAKALAKAFGAPLFAQTVSRLVVDLNRSEHHPQVFSPAMAELSPVELEGVMRRYYHPHRDEVAAWVEKKVALGRVLHIAVHSFTPVLDGDVRTCELGLLYDPKRSSERQMAGAMIAAMRSPATSSHVRLRRNYPYHGAADGFTTALRHSFSAQRYAGLEVEMNQALVTSKNGQKLMTALLSHALRALFKDELVR